MFSIVDLPKQFRPKTSIQYPPFKNGRYMEEYFYDSYLEFLKRQQEQQEQEQQQENNEIIRTYIPVFWTNLQNHPGFTKTKQTLSLLLSDKLRKYEKENPNSVYFTIIQHDDGILLDIPKTIREKLLIFGACSGDIPLPLIYEDTTNTLENYRIKHEYTTEKRFLASFIGSETHPVRKVLADKLRGQNKIGLYSEKTWTNSVSDSAADKFLDLTIKSDFCLAPRGYGRSSFRFFETIQLGVPPIYIWDDKEWLPYKNLINYSKFVISIHFSQIEHLPKILESISNETYSNMLRELKEHRKKGTFSLDFMVDYIVNTMKNYQK